MSTPELRIGNQAAYLRKSIKTPDFGSHTVLTRDAFQFIDLWLSRNCKDALPYWKQAANYYHASERLSSVSSPLILYYCFLNAAKALLIVKKFDFSDKHGVSGKYKPKAKRVLSNETVKIQTSGIISSLASYLYESKSEKEYRLTDLLANLPFIHRSYRHTFKSQKELFIPIKNPAYRKDPKNGNVWFSAEIRGRYADRRSLKTISNEFNFEKKNVQNYIIRSHECIKWFNQGESKDEKDKALERLHVLHEKLRINLSFISAPTDLWYIKREMSGAKVVKRYNMTIIMMIMHRLSELSRYDPKGLSKHLDGKANWLLKEFLELSPAQFVDELACEMTSLELRLPGVRSQ